MRSCGACKSWPRRCVSTFLEKKMCDTPAAPHPPSHRRRAAAGTAPYRTGPMPPGDHPVATAPGPHFCGGAPLGERPQRTPSRRGLVAAGPFSAFFLSPNSFDRFSAHAIRSILHESDAHIRSAADSGFCHACAGRRTMRLFQDPTGHACAGRPRRRRHSPLTCWHLLHPSDVPPSPADAADHHAYLHITHARADRWHICQPGPQHPHSYAQMQAPLMLLRPMRTWGGLGGQPGGTRGGDAAGIIQIRVAAAAAASRPIARTHRIPGMRRISAGGPARADDGSRPCAHTHV
eukprot:SAG25_NODE_863_length_5020_cov_15.176793_3_plen_291_part_00